MNTPPPESEFPKLEMIPSVSMPTLQPLKVDSSQPSVYRRRRHTITRPDSALELLSMSDSDDGEQDDQTLDRISDILSNLIQEANEAVQNDGKASKPRPRSAILRSAPIHNTTNSRPKSILSISRLPRPVWSGQQRTHDRQSSISSSASSSSLFSPAPATESPITASSVDQSHYFLDQPDKYKKSPSLNGGPDIFDLVVDHADQDITMDETQPTHDTIEPHQDILQTIQHRLDDPLMESFRRLDSSMAMVESLSRDLAEQDDDTQTSTSRLTLLLLPLLHIPHALITTMFDTIISPGNTSAWKLPTSSSPSSPLSGIMAWTLCFAIANMVVTWSGVPPWFLGHRQRRLSLPGSYQSDDDHRMIRSKRPAPINTSLFVKKPSCHSARLVKRSSNKRRITTSYRHPTTLMTTSHSNDRSYTLAIQQSRAQRMAADDWETIEPTAMTRRNSF